MDAEVIVGCIIIALALIVLTGLVFWSRRRIERVARTGHRSARQILKDLSRGR